MRNAKGRKTHIAVMILTAAWLGGWIDISSAHGAQNKSCNVSTSGNYPGHGFTGDQSWPAKSWPTSRPWATNKWPSKPWPGGSSPHGDWGRHAPCTRPSHDPSQTNSSQPGSATDQGPFIQLTSAALNGTTPISSITITGSHGAYVAQTVTVTGPASTAGSLTVSGFNPTNDEEIYGLAATTNNLSTLIAELNSAVSAADSGATAEAVPSSLASVLAGDNIAVIFQNNGTSPNIFSYNLEGNTTGAIITSITVVPEPAAMGALALGVVGFAARRKRR